MHAHVPQIFPITNRAQAHTSIPCPFSPLGPALSPFLLSLSLCLFSFLPLLPSPFSIATLRNVFYAPARSYTHAYNVPTPRTVAQELLDRRVLFPLPPPRSRSTVPSLFFPRAHSLSPSRPSSPLSLPFKRSPFPARSSSRPGPRIFSRARLSRCNDAIARCCLEFPARFSGIFAASVRPCHIWHV